MCPPNITLSTPTTVVINMAIQVIDKLHLVNRDEWNALIDPDHPFAKYEFLDALETYGCCQTYGWYPQHIIMRDEKQQLIGAVPMYIKDNSYGEFVFDMAWADAYERSGLQYYPKLVVSMPYTPATGKRLFIHPDAPTDTASKLIQFSIRHAQSLGVSSLHWLFTDTEDTNILQQENLLLRMGIQYHWHNLGYESFDHYLTFFNSKHRKNVKRERRKVVEQDIRLELKSGQEMTSSDWHDLYNFYAGTFAEKWGTATLSHDFFESIGESMPDDILVGFASHASTNTNYVAASFFIKGTETLYGRYWGCNQTFNNLHFELCYYQGLDYCITHGLKNFEPGAQGEHKISRGFLPTSTWSAHWIAHPQFKDIIENYLLREIQDLQTYKKQLMQLSPFKQTDSTLPVSS